MLQKNAEYIIQSAKKNEYVWQQVDFLSGSQELLQSTVKRCKLSWIDHVIRHRRSYHKDQWVVVVAESRSHLHTPCESRGGPREKYISTHRLHFVRFELEHRSSELFNSYRYIFSNPRHLPTHFTTHHRDPHSEIRLG